VKVKESALEQYLIAAGSLVSVILEAQLPQSERADRATRYVNKFVLCFTSYRRYNGFIQQKWPSKSFKGIDSGAIR